MQFKRILYPVDWDFSVNACEYALTVAEYYKAHLVALHAVELSKYPYADYVGATGDFAHLSGALCEGGRAKLRVFTKKRSRHGVEPQLVVDPGNVPDLIVLFAERHNVELLVMGTHGRRGFGRLALGSTIDRAISNVCSPVLVVSNPAHKVLTTGPGGKPRLSRVLYCTDISINSERVLQYAISLAAECGGELTMFHVVEGAPDLTAAEVIIAARTEQLDQLISDGQPKHLNVRTAGRCSKPYEEIVGMQRRCKHTSWLRPRGGDALDRAVFGSTTSCGPVGTRSWRSTRDRHQRKVRFQ
jgi:nucleotide-binding universal stress UspA family protein